jgi:hypothetical protein
MAEPDTVAEAHQVVELAVGLRTGAQPLGHAPGQRLRGGRLRRRDGQQQPRPRSQLPEPAGEQLAQRAGRGQRIGQDRGPGQLLRCQLAGDLNQGQRIAAAFPEQASPGVRA